VAVRERAPRSRRRSVCRDEEVGVALFAQIAGDDLTGIEGLPLTAVSRMLRAANSAV
jgi:predicted house-cleaning NTP pyrophosphatase (Maf/HAM1 superfamily)